MLEVSYRQLADAVTAEQAITPAAEWLLDNYHIVTDQIREVWEDLPRSFYRQLPKVVRGEWRGLPRVYRVVARFVHHTDSRFDPDAFRNYIEAYQEHQPLTLGELWATAITLRILLIENLRQSAERIIRARQGRREADEIADQVLGLGRPRVEAADLTARLEQAQLSMYFAVHLFQRLREQGPVADHARNWLREALSREHLTGEELVALEHSRQAAMNVSVRNIITSMRLLTSYDWRDLVESVSLVDRILHDGSTFRDMDFPTRDQYRHAVEEVARWAGCSELQVARTAVRLAGEGRGRRGEPGYYLLADGRVRLEQAIEAHVPRVRRLLRAFVALGGPGYAAALLLVTILAVAVPISLSLGRLDAWVIAGMTLLAWFPASELAAALVNRLATAIVKPRLFPKMELARGIAPDDRTFVVIPTLLTGLGQIESQVSQLEIHYLSNPDENLFFALLSDFTDAEAEVLPEDDALLARAREAIGRLNERHGPAAGTRQRFFLLHRRRVWNPSERCWMGWERKRGKLHELNRLLRGDTRTTFFGDRATGLPENVRFVVTLDADTRLPLGAVRRLVGTMTHPLNRAVYDADAGLVTEGYGVLQPRVTLSLPTDHEASLFQRTYAGPRGVDPYAAAVSDVYQDLYGEGSYTGKGIYDLDAFEAALTGKVPDNRVLSHDLFEGTFARAGLVTDIELFEEYPPGYLIAAARQHRWTRGDFQLLPWILRGKAGPEDRPTRIPLIGRWKMLDNLRRSVTQPATFLTFVAAGLQAGSVGRIWTAFVLVTLVVPAVMPVALGLLPKRRDVSKRAHVLATVDDLAQGLTRVLLTLVFLPHQAWLQADAAVRAMYRLAISKRGLLEWVAAAQAGRSLRGGVLFVTWKMRVALLMTLGISILALLANAEQRTAPFLGLWLLASPVAWFSSIPRRKAEMPLDDSDRRTLRRIARQTWRYFEAFVRREDNWLPPDNFQEDPEPVLARRTSPSNIGLYLMSAVAARDFGWLGTTDLVRRLQETFATLKRLETFRGHFFNWYATDDLRPLEPRYVSSVDSGNLASNLLVVSRACQELIEGPAVDFSRAIEGLDDSWLALCAATEGRPPPALARMHEVVLSRQRPVESHALAQTLAGLREIAADLEQTRPPIDADDWVVALSRDLESLMADVGTLAPWALAGAPHTPAAATVIDGLLLDMPSLAEAPTRYRQAAAELERRPAPLDPMAGEAPDERDELTLLCRHLRASADACESLAAALESLAQTARGLFEAMDFSFLYDETRGLLSIGYRASEGVLDASYYDLLASEARLASYLAIARGQVPWTHWFHLGRPLTPVDRGAALISWSGSMFEYLMPALVMQSPGESLLGQTYRLIVRRQRSYGRQRRVPWGISEAAYSARDLERTYQYSGFGVPGLGLARGLSQHLVVAPYATALASMIDARAAISNFSRLEMLGVRGRYGFYESVDFTPRPVRDPGGAIIVRTFMAHHQGMTIVALANVTLENVMRRRFHREPSVEACDLLLQERTPRDVSVARPRAEEVAESARVREPVPPQELRFTTPHEATPRTHLLSNGRYTVLMSAAGSGASRWRDLAVNRWRNDPAQDNCGCYFYIRDVDSGEVWSAGHQPVAREPQAYVVRFQEHSLVIERQDHGVASRLEVVVSPEQDAELRSVSLTNLGSNVRELEVTSYLEVVLAPAAADLGHMAFSNLFVETQPLGGNGLLARRRSSREETAPWLGHVLAVDGELIGQVQWETDRGRFLGRNRSAANPVAVFEPGSLSNTTGFVLDPVLCLRARVRLLPGASTHLVFTTFVCAEHGQAVRLADTFCDPASFERAVALAWTQAQVQLGYYQVAADEAGLYQQLANRVIYPVPPYSAGVEAVDRVTGGVPALWSLGISGDLPIVVVRIDSISDIDVVRQTLRAYDYWCMKGFAVDLVVLDDRAPSYGDELQTAVEDLLRHARDLLTREPVRQSGGSLRMLLTLLVGEAPLASLLASARLIIYARQGGLADQLHRAQPDDEVPAAPAAQHTRRSLPDKPPDMSGLELFNGRGGFSDNGREYVTLLPPGAATPSPWVNVVANPAFGFIASESGGGYTWAVNSRENKLTPASNDRVTDAVSEAVFIRDDDSGAVWTATASPIRLDTTYVARHGLGYTRYELDAHRIHADLVQSVPLDDPVKLSVLRLTNRSERRRRLRVTSYAELLLGVAQGLSVNQTATKIDPDTGALFAVNPWNMEVGRRVAFMDLLGLQTSFSSDRVRFLGRNGSLGSPSALAAGTDLDNRIGSPWQACAALQTLVTLEPGEERQVVVLFGQGATEEEARSLVRRYRLADLRSIREEAVGRWRRLSAAVQVHTPDRSLDILINGWLLYQTVSSRLWARAGFYQTSGAFGFRDQLQDILALRHAQPALARQHLLHAAARQFVEGDVQHWWHVPSGKGVRTRISDDRLWLPYCLLRYLDTTGDSAILEERVPFLDGPPLGEDQKEHYFQPPTSTQAGTLYEHCARAIDCSLVTGAHGLPLFGTGDWNDGMNRVGQEGKGESVWLGWFLAPILQGFSRLAAERGERHREAEWRLHLARLRQAVENAWDGAWYRRGYFDDGTPLGSSQSAECQIDSIAQSWAVMSGLADQTRAEQAMHSAHRLLVDRNESLVNLCAPPFTQKGPDPGYIAEYPPGVRENGGQYSHAAVWLLMAFAGIGDANAVDELLSMLNPIRRSNSPRRLLRYEIEPYVMAGDVYSMSSQAGRGGWSWYTGSAGWMYQACVEWVLGLRVRRGALTVDPCVPPAWRGFTADLQFGASSYRIEVDNGRGLRQGVTSIEVDGKALPDTSAVPLVDDARVHQVRVVLG